MKKDIQNRQDIDALMRHFYVKLLDDETMSPIFVKVVEKGLDHHFATLVDFWDNILFFTGAYKKNAMAKHLEINAWYTLEKKHFEGWLSHFNDSVDELHAGEKAEMAKNRAKQIAILMEMKCAQMTEGIRNKY